MQFYFNSFFLFYSNYPLYVSVVRPSSGGNIYIGNFQLKMVVRPKHVADNLNLGSLHPVACVGSR
jgi:hypothetical protein